MASSSAKRPLEPDNESNTTPTKRPKTNPSTPRAFQHVWLNAYDWLEYDTNSKHMLCKICVKVQKHNMFTTGCTTMKKDNLSKHEKSKDHRDAIEANRLATSMKNAKTTATSKSQMAVTAAMRNVYFMAKKNMPSSLVPDLNKLCIMQGNTALKDLRVDSHTTYEHNTSINDFQDSMVTVLTEEIVNKIKQFEKFSLMIDESTDVSVKQNLVTYIRILDSDEYNNIFPATYFLGISDLYRANAQTIFEKVVDCLKSKKINISGLCLVSVFLEETTGKALSLYKPITCYKFLYVSHFLADSLKPLAFLSKFYQSQDLNFSDIQPLLTATINSLKEIRDKKSSENLSKFINEVPAEPQIDMDGLETFEFGGHKIRDSHSQRIEADKICTDFINKMIKSLMARFSDTEDTAILTSLTNFFNPLLKDSDISADIDTIFEYLVSFGFEGTKHELNSFSKFSRNHHSIGSKTVVDIKTCCNLAIRNKETFPACCELAQRLLIAPVSTADCERGFSKQNLIKTAPRNTITPHNLENLMSLSINGPDLDNFDFKRAFEVWAEKKNRRILM